jgi:hypothetical protein
MGLGMAATNGEIERRLWSAADELRTTSRLKASVYSMPVLGLTFRVQVSPHWNSSPMRAKSSFMNVSYFTIAPDDRIGTLSSRPAWIFSAVHR